MKQIYNFEQAAPPVLTEALLRQRAKDRKQAAMAMAAGILMELCIVLLAILLSDPEPVWALLCLGYVVVSLAGSSVILVYFRKNRRFLLQ